jgi:hypothetical protein
MEVKKIIIQLESLLNEIDDYNRRSNKDDTSKTALELERSYELIRDGKEILDKYDDK